MTSVGRRALAHPRNEVFVLSREPPQASDRGARRTAMGSASARATSLSAVSPGSSESDADGPGAGTPGEFVGYLTQALLCEATFEVGEHADELVAAEAHHEVRRPQTGLQGLGYAHEQPVPGRVPVSVVDGFSPSTSMKATTSVLWARLARSISRSSAAIPTPRRSAPVSSSVPAEARSRAACSRSAAARARSRSAAARYAAARTRSSAAHWRSRAACRMRAPLSTAVRGWASRSASRAAISASRTLAKRSRDPAASSRWAAIRSRAIAVRSRASEVVERSLAVIARSADVRLRPRVSSSRAR